MPTCSPRSRPSRGSVQLTSTIATFLPQVLAHHTFDEDTVLVGHSGGAALLLAVLEHIEARVDQAILVAGYCTQPGSEDEPVLQDAYDWSAIRAHVRDLYRDMVDAGGGGKDHSALFLHLTDALTDAPTS